MRECCSPLKVRVMPVDDRERPPAVVRHAFWIDAAILVFAIAIGGPLGDNDLTFAVAGAGGVVWLVGVLRVHESPSRSRPAR